MSALPFAAAECARAFAAGEVSALELAEAALERIAAANPALNAYTAVTAERALADAAALDGRRRRGEPLPPLAGVPYAVKNLFDVAGLTTLAGSRSLADRPPAVRDGALVARMAEAGGLLTGALNMDALAYGFTTENTFFGATRNPRDPARTAGGSSGGSGAAVAGGLVPVALASDTNGSIRVPASLCGVFGLKPTYGRLPRSGSFPFVDSLDHLGPLAATAEDLALAYDALQGPDPADPACAQRPPEPARDHLARGVENLRVARLTGYFDEQAGPLARRAAELAAAALGAGTTVELPEVPAARAAAFLITASEGGALHLDALRERPEDFEPLSRDRLLAGALTPAAWINRAQRLRFWFRAQALALLAEYDLLVAPATPVPATLLGQESFDLNGRELPTRPNLGLLTQPISFIGLPVAVAPLWPEGALPVGVQLIAAPWREDLCLRAARALELAGLADARIGRLQP
jgi:AtzE family amidohydrolase